MARLKMRLFIKRQKNQLRGFAPVRALAHVGLALSLLASTTPAFAGDDVGVAVTVRNEVTGKLQSQTLKIDSGSAVFGKEIVKTNPDSTAKIVLKDNTNLNVGPNSSLTLDKFVFNGENDYQKAAFNLPKGALRFTSGQSDKRAYEMKTPVGTIGVRGTQYTVAVVGNTVRGYVSEGEVTVCNEGGCKTFHEGESFTITPKTVEAANWGSGLENLACQGGCGEATSYSTAMNSTTTVPTINGIPLPAVLAGLGVAGAGAAAGVAGSNNSSNANNNNSGSNPLFPASDQ
jgi:hypothetical protein